MDDISLLQAKIDDLVRKSENFGCVCTRFLSPKESFDLQKYIRFSHPGVTFFVDGGYPDAERVLIFIIADYFDKSFVCKEDFYRLICIEGSGYYQNSHRDFLGSLLGLGITREMIGDIYIDGKFAYAFVLPGLADFLLTKPCPLTTVGRDKVRVYAENLDHAVSFKRDFECKSLLVSSLRLDCVVSGVLGVSRDKCDKLISMGAVTRNYEISDKAHTEVKDDDVISVKGYGKYRIRLTGVFSKKGKIKVNAMKYI